MTENELSKILGGHDTVLIATIREIVIGGAGGFHRRWAIVMEVDEVLRGEKIGPSIVTYVHSPTQEFPLLEEKERIGAKTLWAFKTKGNAFVSAVHLSQLEPLDRVLVRVRKLLE